MILKDKWFYVLDDRYTIQENKVILYDEVKQAVLLFEEYLKDNDVPAKNLLNKYKQIFGDFEEDTNN